MVQSCRFQIDPRQIGNYFFGGVIFDMILVQIVQLRNIRTILILISERNTCDDFHGQDENSSAQLWLNIELNIT